MRSLKDIKYDRLITGKWYGCIISNCKWYFKFLNYNDDNFIISSECYSPYNDNELFHSKNHDKILTSNEDIKNIREISYSWLMENIVNGKEIK